MPEGTQVAKQQDPSAIFVGQMETRLRPEISKVLPGDITVEAFERVVQTAVIHNPDLLSADRKSLMTACVEAAEDGLKTDGKEGALVIYNMKDKKTDTWTKVVRWMPMIQGIYKKVRQSGEVATIVADVVYASDEFSFERGDEERLFHRPNVFSQDRGMPIGAYAIATLKDGSREREIMSTADVERVREVSKSKDKGPWNDWWGEMAKKTVIRRLAKRLPMSAEARKTVQREDDLYDFGRIPAEDAPPRPTRQSYQQIEPPAEPKSDLPPEVEADDFEAEAGAMDQQFANTVGPADEPDPAQEISPCGGEETSSDGNGSVDQLIDEFKGIATVEGLQTKWAEAGPDILNALSDDEYNRLNNAYRAREQELCA